MEQDIISRDEMNDDILTRSFPMQEMAAWRQLQLLHASIAQQEPNFEAVACDDKRSYLMLQ